MLQFLALGAGLISATANIKAARDASTEAKYNAKLKESQAQMIGSQKDLDNYQWDRNISRSISTFTQKIAKAGITMSGSPMAAMQSTITQMEFDKSIEQWNYDWQKRGVLSEAAAYRREAKSVKMQGYANAFSSLLTAGTNFAILNKKY
jgi:hypothetical protein